MTVDNFSAQYMSLHFQVVDLSGSMLARCRVPENLTPAQLKLYLSSRSRLRVPRELIQLVDEHCAVLRPVNMALIDLGVHNGATITCVILQPPQDFDIVGDCDCCDEYRHLFYGYSMQWWGDEPVIALCQACGGSKQSIGSDDSSVPYEVTGNDAGQGLEEEDHDAHAMGDRTVKRRRLASHTGQ